MVFCSYNIFGHFSFFWFDLAPKWRLITNGPLFSSFHQFHRVFRHILFPPSKGSRLEIFLHHFGPKRINLVYKITIESYRKWIQVIQSRAHTHSVISEKDINYAPSWPSSILIIPLCCLRAHFQHVRTHSPVVLALLKIYYTDFRWEGRKWRPPPPRQLLRSFQPFARFLISFG